MLFTKEQIHGIYHLHAHALLLAVSILMGMSAYWSLSLIVILPKLLRILKR